MLSTHEIEDILDRFRTWLQETSEELDDPEVVALAERLCQRASHEPSENGNGTLVGLVQVAESFTALRHEIKLQTKGLRGLHENVESSRQAVSGAVDVLTDARKAAEDAAETTARPLLNAIIDVDEAVGQAVSVIEQSIVRHAQQTQTQQSSPQQAMAKLDAEFRTMSAWQRWWSQTFWNRIRSRLESVIAVKSQQHHAAEETLEGLQMLRSRLRRVLAESEVEPMACVGQRFDPHTMRVVETVPDATQPPETVVDEVRTGYEWKSKTFRLAEVRATKS